MFQNNSEAWRIKSKNLMGNFKCKGTIIKIMFLWCYSWQALFNSEIDPHKVSHTYHLVSKVLLIFKH